MRANAMPTPTAGASPSTKRPTGSRSRGKSTMPATVTAAIAPGVFETEMVASLRPDAHERITTAVPLQRTGSVEELAHAVEFIIENDYYSGRVLELDGGLRL